MSDIVFCPNHTEKFGVPGARTERFLEDCADGQTNWTCKSTAVLDDLYLFYFDAPERAVVGVGVCSSPAKPETGKFDWKQTVGKAWFCDFEPLIALDERLTIDQIKADAILQRWWKTAPYQGRPKGFKNATARARTLDLIVAKNPRLAGMLRPYRDGRPVPRVPAVRSVTDDDDAPKRVQYTLTRVVRNTAKGDYLKGVYGGCCQVCRKVSLVSPTQPYVEVHHLRPLGRDHRGMDNHDNMLVLCALCHVKFDYLALAIEPGTMRVVSFDGKMVAPTCCFDRSHRIANENVHYHWNRFVTLHPERSVVRPRRHRGPRA